MHSVPAGCHVCFKKLAVRAHSRVEEGSNLLTHSSATFACIRSHPSQLCALPTPQLLLCSCSRTPDFIIIFCYFSFALFADGAGQEADGAEQPQERPHVLLLQQQLRASREALRLSLETDTVLTPEGKKRRRSSDPNGGGRGSRPLSIFSITDGRPARVSRLRNWIVRKLRAGFSSNKNQPDSQRRRRSGVPVGEDDQEAAASSNGWPAAQWSIAHSI
jgi:hypothetical protein